MKKNILVIGLSAIILFSAVSACAAQTTRYVNPDGSCDGNNPCHTTIQAAIDDAGPGDTIFVQAGTYNEYIHIPGGLDGLQLIGAGKAVSIIEGKKAVGPDGECIDVESPVTIQGFTIKPDDATTGIRIEKNGFDASGTEADPGIIRNNKIENFTSGYGVGFGSNDHIEWWEITNNEFYNLYQGIYFEDASNLLVSENTFTDCKAACAGIAGDNIQIVWNNFAGSTKLDSEAIGFGACRPTYLTIAYNIITGYEYGIRVYSGGSCENASVQVYCNNIAGNALCGIQNQDTEANLDATNNWWGDSRGPSLTPGHPDPGDPVCGNVLYDPWLPCPFQQCPECGGIQAPAFSTLGVFSLIGLLSAILVIAIVRKRE